MKVDVAGFLRGVAERAAANWLAAVGLAAGALVLGLLWKFAAFLRTPIPLSLAVAGTFLGIAAGAALTAKACGAWPGHDRKAHIGALVALQKAGGDRIYARQLRVELGLDQAHFELLLHGLRAKGYIYDSEHDCQVFYPGQDPPRTISVMGPGRTLLQRELRRRPDLFS